MCAIVSNANYFKLVISKFEIFVNNSSSKIMFNFCISKHLFCIQFCIPKFKKRTKHKYHIYLKKCCKSHKQLFKKHSLFVVFCHFRHIFEFAVTFSLCGTHTLLFTKCLILGLSCELGSPLNDWLESTSPINHPEDYKIRVLTQELKIWWIRQ